MRMISTLGPLTDLAASVGMTAADLGMHLAGGSSRAGADDAEAASAAGAGGEEEEVRQLQRWQQQAAEAAGGEAGAPGRRRSLRDEVAAMTEALLQGGDGGFSDSEGGQGLHAALALWCADAGGLADQAGRPCLLVSCAVWSACGTQSDAGSDPIPAD